MNANAQLIRVQLDPVVARISAMDEATSPTDEIQAALIDQAGRMLWAIELLMHGQPYTRVLAVLGLAEEEMGRIKDRIKLMVELGLR